MSYGEELTKKIDAAYAANNNEDGLRTHLGGSVLGHVCMREVWYGLRWADSEKHDGRMLRLFNRGHREELVFAELLRMVGATVWTMDPNTGEQFRISAMGGHLGGSIDGVALNLPDMTGIPVLLEMKTHKEKYFNDLVKKGNIKDSVPKHFKQSQFYMGHMKLGWCLYCAVNKNDDRLWFDLFQFDAQVFHQLEARGESIIFGQGIPPRISDNSGWFECRLCNMWEVCWNRKQPKKNCRTCMHSSPNLIGGGWSCDCFHPEIKTQPKLGCDLHALIPALDTSV
jgi:hypothetical protein